MPRKNRYHLPGLVWHITHRCHDKRFLLKFKKDRDRYRHWLFEAKKRYGLRVLNYIITSNHIHLLVFDSGKPNVIEASMQLTQGRIAQEYNRRKKRLGAFWQDRYHATAVQTGKHLQCCMTYIDLNMVRAGVVAHPILWPSSGYREILHPPKRYRLIDLDTVVELLHLSSTQEISAWQEQRIQLSLLQESALLRDKRWTESVAVGDAQFLHRVADRLGFQARYKKIKEYHDMCSLHETVIPYRFNPDT